MTKKQREIAKKALCEWLAESKDMTFVMKYTSSQIKKRIVYAFAVTVEEREFCVFQFERSYVEAPRMGVSGGFTSEDDENCAAFSGFDEFPKNHAAAEKLAKKLAEHILKG